MADTEKQGVDLSRLYAERGGPRAVFSSKVADYQASRPDYPAALYEALKVFCPPGEGEWVAEVGAGTGLFTRGLLDNGYQVLAVEPNVDMRRAAEEQLGGRKGVRVVEGSAEEIPLKDHSVSLVAAAQAFHWFEAKRAKAEFLRVLNPRGLVALVWNDRVITDELHMALDDLFAKFGGDARGVVMAHEDRAAVPLFFGASRPYQFVWPHTQELGEAGLLSLAFSRSYMPDRNTKEGEAVAAWTRDIYRCFCQNDHVTVRYQTVAVIGRPE